MVVNYRIFEPKRPTDYTELPLYDREDYWHCMFRTVDIKSDELVEVPQYPDQMRRVVTFFLMLLMIFTFFAAIINIHGSVGDFVDEVKHDYEYVFDFEELSRREYRGFWAGDTWDQANEDIFVQEQLNGKLHSYRILNNVFPFISVFLFMTLLFFYLSFFTCRACPLRFDRKREVAYTWHKGRFWIADIGPFLGGMDTRLAPEDDGHPIYGHDTSVGALALKMFPVDNRWESREFKIGIYPVCHAHQSHDLRMFLQAFMSKHLYEPGHSEEWVRRKDWDANWLKKITRGRFFPYDPMRWLGKKSFIRCDFDEAATETALLDYLTAPATPNRGKRRGVGTQQIHHR